MPDEPAASPAEEPVPDPDLVPRPSKMRYVAIFFAGLLVGRLASENFAPGPLDALDLFMYVGLAFSIAWAWRSWARRAMVQRHLAAERRRVRQAATSPTSDAQAATSPTSDASEGSPATEQTRSAPRRKRARRR